MSKKALLGAVLPFISNPVVLTVVGIGAVGWTVYEIFSGKEKKQDNGSEAVPDGSEPYDEPLIDEVSTVPDTVIEPLEMVEVTVNSSVEEPYVSTVFGSLNNEPLQDQAVSEEASKKEMIRQAMSELGKRSAAARKKRKHDD